MKLSYDHLLWMILKEELSGQEEIPIKSAISAIIDYLGSLFVCLVITAYASHGKMRYFLLSFKKSGGCLRGLPIFTSGCTSHKAESPHQIRRQYSPDQ